MAAKVTAVRGNKFQVETNGEAQDIPFEAVAAILRYAGDTDFLWSYYSVDAQALEIAAPVMLAAGKVMAQVSLQLRCPAEA